jgi:hypothetical protein
MDEQPVISIKIGGQEAVQRFLETVPRGTIKVAMAAISEYILGDDRHGLRYEPARVNHGTGNKYKWNSEKQRRAFFATKGFGGGIPSKRTGKMKEGWRVSVDPYRTTIYNRVRYAQFVVGDNQQRGHKADKWRHVAQIVQDNLHGAFRSARSAVGKWIATHK